jgi:hypothetical protein
MRSRLSQVLSNTPRWAKQVGALMVGAAAVAGGVAAILPYVEPSPTPILAVDLGPPEWVVHDRTLGSYIAWQRRESSTLGLKALNDGETAQVLGGGAVGAETAPTVVRLARYASSLHEVDTGSAQPASAATRAAETSNATAGGGESGPTGTSSDTEPSSSTSTPTPTTPTSITTSTSATGTVSVTVTTGEGKGVHSAVPLRAGVLHEAGDHLSHTGVSRLQRKVQQQEAILHNPELQPSGEALSTCRGIAYGGCAPEAVIEAQEEKATAQAPSSSSSSSSGTESNEGEGAGEEAPPKRPTQSQRELLEIANGALLGRADDSSQIPALMTAGMSDTERARVASMLGDAVSFEVHTKGWNGQRLWLAWTMYEKQGEYWNPSQHEYLIDHAEAYLVPTATDDKGILTFWFPVPRQQGDYEVRYFIRAPGSGAELAHGKSHSFRP